jgi:hypothetical protein
MKEISLIKLHFVFLIPALIGIWLLLMLQNAQAAALETLHAALPNRVTEWTAEPKDHIYDRQTIFSYIDGAGEVYRAYNMQKCLSRRYTAANGPAIVLDVFDMGSSEDAYGVFTHDREGEVLNIGQGAVYRPGWLSFWKDRFFVSIYMEEERTDAEAAVRALGRRIASLIPQEGPKPDILLKLPQEGLKHKTVRYLHHYLVLNYHFYVSDDNILNLGPDTEAVLAEYHREKERALLLVVSYPNANAAADAREGFLKHYLPDADPTGMALQENGKWSGAAANGELVAVTFDADSRSYAQHLLERVLEIPPHR